MISKVLYRQHTDKDILSSYRVEYLSERSSYIFSGLDQGTLTEGRRSVRLTSLY
jgi:hypothetical protein